MSAAVDEHFGELERAFFAAGEVDVEPASAAVAIESFDDLSAIAAIPAARSPWRQRLIPLYRLGRLWLSMRVRLFLSMLRGFVPVALPLLVRTTELPPRFYTRRPFLTVAAVIVLGSTLVSVWAGVVLAATRLG